MKAKNSGFTLVEILIVVVILGILAAIVIPQFTEASSEAKLSSLCTDLQTMRSQIELFKIQHNDNPPVLATFALQMENYSDVAGTAVADNNKDVATGVIYGPYVQSMPVNPWNDSETLGAADVAGVGWVYDAVTGDLHIGIADLDVVNDAEIITILQDAGTAL